MAKGSGYVRIWNKEARLPENLSNETKRFLIEYTKLDPRKMEEHIIHIAKTAFEIESYPCFQKFMFLDFDLYKSLRYQIILNEIKSGSLFLDLGCGLGQDLRRLVYDGAPSENLIGLELQQGFVDLGYMLFRDKTYLKAKFVVQSFFLDTPEITCLAKNVKFINSGMFMHLWDWGQQKEVAKRMIHLLSEEKGAIITGLHFGSRSAGMWGPIKESPMFVQSSSTLKDLWNECAHETSTSWHFHCLVDEDDRYPDIDPEVCILRWTAERI